MFVNKETTYLLLTAIIVYMVKIKKKSVSADAAQVGCSTGRCSSEQVILPTVWTWPDVVEFRCKFLDPDSRIRITTDI